MLTSSEWAPERFLSPQFEPRVWSIEGGSTDRITPQHLFLGRGDYPLEVATAQTGSRPAIQALRRLWRHRNSHRPNPLLLVVIYPGFHGYAASVCGPIGEDPPVFSDIPVEEVERLCAEALRETDRHAAIRLLRATLPEVESELPGVRNAGMFATHELRTGVPQRGDWDQACAHGQPLLNLRGRALIKGLGFEIEELAAGTVSVLRVAGTKRAIAVFLEDNQSFESIGPLFNQNSPVTYAMGHADREGLPWVVLTRGSQIRVYSARTDVGVGRKGREDTFVELNLSLLPPRTAGYLPLLASAEALMEGGTFEQILQSSSDYAADLGSRLRERVYQHAVPALATALARNQGNSISEADLSKLYEQALIALFRILFVAYAEDKDLLPYRTNGRYQHHALKTLAKTLAAEARAEGRTGFDEQAIDLWQDLKTLWQAVGTGNSDWGVPAYDGELFSDDPAINSAGAVLYDLQLTNAEIGPVLMSLLVDEGPDGVIGPVDFRSLSVREFGTIYEGLLESRLSIAPMDLTVDQEGNYRPAGDATEVVVSKGEVYFHTRSGARKSSGTYFTKPFAVEHLLDHALKPALEDHVHRLEQLAEQGDEAAVADKFFDFRCVDLAMGSGHFLVAAVDRIEAQLSAFLAHHPVPQIQAELGRLRAAALKRLGNLADGVEIEQASLLRRQIARRCVYGVDLNRIAVELARLSLWIHTFVPGLPLSFLDHNLVHGNSLTGIGTVDEALEALAPDEKGGGIFILREQIEGFLARAGDDLRRLVHISETSIEEAGEARQAHEEALEAIKPARQLFDILIAARLGKAKLPTKVSEEMIARHPDLQASEQHAKDLDALHFPIAFPEVFIRGNPGFDCILGNPPWEEVKFEERDFWTIHFPGHRSLTAAEQKRKAEQYKKERPDLVYELEQTRTRKGRLASAIRSCPYPGMSTGDPDLYKAFCWRFWHLVREGGAIGVVLPRSALSAAGSQHWREAILDGGTFDQVTFLLNRAGWVFDDAEHRYTIGLVSVRKGLQYRGTLRIRGPYTSREQYDAGVAKPPVEIPTEEFRSWTGTAAFPLLPSPEALEVFLKLRAHLRLDADIDDWHARPVTELHATNDKKHMILDPGSTTGLWPVYGGASFDLWNPDTGQYYAWADPKHITNVLEQKRLRQQRNRRSAFSAFSPEWAADPNTLPCQHPRIAFRLVSRATDTRTFRVALIPGNVVLTNAAPYLLWSRGDERDEAYLLGMLSSIPLDWYARRFVETNLNFHIFNAFPIPHPSRDHPLRQEVVKIAGGLAAVDDRFSSWAAAVGVKVGSVTDDEARADLIARLDACVALLYGLDKPDVELIFETFHETWDPAERLKRVFKHYNQIKKELKGV